MSSAADETLREVKRIADVLATLAADDPRREALVQRRDELRVAARDMALAGRPVAALQKELSRLRARRAALDSEKVQIPKWQKQTGGYFTDPEAAGSRINEKLDLVNKREIESIERAIQEIERVLRN